MNFEYQYVRANDISAAELIEGEQAGTLKIFSRDASGILWFKRRFPNIKATPKPTIAEQIAAAREMGFIEPIDDGQEIEAGEEELTDEHLAAFTAENLATINDYIPGQDSWGVYGGDDEADDDN